MSSFVRTRFLIIPLAVASILSVDSTAEDVPPGKVMALLQELGADGHNRIDQTREPWIIVEQDGTIAI